jgi:hypothetical protein
MEGTRPFQAAVASRSLTVAVIAAVALALGRQYVPALALLAGAMVGVAYLFHIAGSFNRLAKGGKAYLAFLPIETVLRVLLAGAAPIILVGRGPLLGYATYLAGFVAPLAVAILLYKKQIDADSAQTGAADETAAKTIA